MKYLWTAALLAFFAMSNTAHAQEGSFSVTITVDENCNGNLTNTTGFNAALFCTQLTDPGPAGLEGAVTYALGNPPGLVSGDLIVNNFDSQVSDVIRFNAAEGINGTTGALVFYSSPGGGSLADEGFPRSFYTNVQNVFEVAGGVTWTPTAGQPGFVAGAAGPVTYIITSDTPEPASAVLMLGGPGLFLLRRYVSKRR